MRFSNLIVGALIAIAFSSVGQADTDLNSWLQEAVPAAEGYLTANLSPEGQLGSVLASPSRSNPDYYYNWVRDAALVMDVYMRELEASTSGEMAMAQISRTFLEDLLWNYISFNEKLQASNAITGIGEPKFHIDGTPYMDNWGRPQNDGPGLRASLLIRFMHYLIHENRFLEAQIKVWPVVQSDLEYLMRNALSPSYDLWEEFKGDNFFTLMADRAALLAGSDAAVWFYDKNLIARYAAEAVAIENVLKGHLNTHTNQIVENMNWVAGSLSAKDTGLDTATVLALIHTDAYPYLKYDSPIVQNTVKALTAKFAQLYPINVRTDVGAAFGRYPEDVYYGGNPWFLTTLAMAEYYYKLGLTTGTKLNQYLQQGDSYMQRVRRHVDGQYHMSEQMDRDDGFLLSARDLSWSYAALLTAVDARTRLMHKIDGTQAGQ